MAPSSASRVLLCVAVSACPLVPGVLRAQLCPLAVVLPLHPGEVSKGPEEGLGRKDTALAAGSLASLCPTVQF